MNKFTLSLWIVSLSTQIFVTSSSLSTDSTIHPSLEQTTFASEGINSHLGLTSTNPLYSYSSMIVSDGTVNIDYSSFKSTPTVASTFTDISTSNQNIDLSSISNIKSVKSLETSEKVTETSTINNLNSMQLSSSANDFTLSSDSMQLARSSLSIIPTSTELPTRTENKTTLETLNTKDMQLFSSALLQSTKVDSVKVTTAPLISPSPSVQPPEQIQTDDIKSSTVSQLETSFKEIFISSIFERTSFATEIDVQRDRDLSSDSFQISPVTGTLQSVTFSDVHSVISLISPSPVVLQTKSSESGILELKSSSEHIMHTPTYSSYENMKSVPTPTILDRSATSLSDEMSQNSLGTLSRTIANKESIGILSHSIEGNSLLSPTNGMLSSTSSTKIEDTLRQITADFSTSSSVNKDYESNNLSSTSNQQNPLGSSNLISSTQDQFEKSSVIEVLSSTAFSTSMFLSIPDSHSFTKRPIHSTDMITIQSELLISYSTTKTTTSFLSVLELDSSTENFSSPSTVYSSSSKSISATSVINQHSHSYTIEPFSSLVERLDSTVDTLDGSLKFTESVSAYLTTRKSIAISDHSVELITPISETQDYSKTLDSSSVSDSMSTIYILSTMTITPTPVSKSQPRVDQQATLTTSMSTEKTTGHLTESSGEVINQSVSPSNTYVTSSYSGKSESTTLTSMILSMPSQSFIINTPEHESRLINHSTYTANLSEHKTSSHVIPLSTFGEGPFITNVSQQFNMHHSTLSLDSKDISTSYESVKERSQTESFHASSTTGFGSSLQPSHNTIHLSLTSSLYTSEEMDTIQVPLTGVETSIQSLETHRFETNSVETLQITPSFGQAIPLSPTAIKSSKSYVTFITTKLGSSFWQNTATSLSGQSSVETSRFSTSICKLLHSNVVSEMTLLSSFGMTASISESSEIAASNAFLTTVSSLSRVTDNIRSMSAIKSIPLTSSINLFNTYTVSASTDHVVESATPLFLTPSSNDLNTYNNMESNTIIETLLFHTSSIDISDTHKSIMSDNGMTFDSVTPVFLTSSHTVSSTIPSKTLGISVESVMTNISNTYLHTIHANTVRTVNQLSTTSSFTVSSTLYSSFSPLETDVISELTMPLPQTFSSLTASAKFSIFRSSISDESIKSLFTTSNAHISNAGLGTSLISLSSAHLSMTSETITDLTKYLFPTSSYIHSNPHLLTTFETYVKSGTPLISTSPITAIQTLPNMTRDTSIESVTSMDATSSLLVSSTYRSLATDIKSYQTKSNTFSSLTIKPSKTFSRMVSRVNVGSVTVFHSPLSPTSSNMQLSLDSLKSMFPTPLFTVSSTKLNMVTDRITNEKVASLIPTQSFTVSSTLVNMDTNTISESTLSRRQSSPLIAPSTIHQIVSDTSLKSVTSPYPVSLPLPSSTYLSIPTDVIDESNIPFSQTPSLSVSHIFLSKISDSSVDSVPSLFITPSFTRLSTLLSSVNYITTESPTTISQSSLRKVTSKYLSIATETSFESGKSFILAPSVSISSTLSTFIFDFTTKNVGSLFPTPSFSSIYLVTDTLMITLESQASQIVSLASSSTFVSFNESTKSPLHIPSLHASSSYRDMTSSFELVTSIFPTSSHTVMISSIYLNEATSSMSDITKTLRETISRTASITSLDLSFDSMLESVTPLFLTTSPPLISTYTTMVPYTFVESATLLFPTSSMKFPSTIKSMEVNTSVKSVTSPSSRQVQTSVIHNSSPASTSPTNSIFHILTGLLTTTTLEPSTGRLFMSSKSSLYSTFTDPAYKTETSHISPSIESSFSDIMSMSSFVSTMFSFESSKITIELPSSHILNVSLVSSPIESYTKSSIELITSNTVAPTVGTFTASPTLFSTGSIYFSKSKTESPLFSTKTFNETVSTSVYYINDINSATSLSSLSATVKFSSSAAISIFSSLLSTPEIIKTQSSFTGYSLSLPTYITEFSSSNGHTTTVHKDLPTVSNSVSSPIHSSQITSHIPVSELDTISTSMKEGVSYIKSTLIDIMPTLYLSTTSSSYSQSITITPSFTGTNLVLTSMSNTSTSKPHVSDSGVLSSTISFSKMYTVTTQLLMSVTTSGTTPSVMSTKSYIRNVSESYSMYSKPVSIGSTSELLTSMTVSTLNTLSVYLETSTTPVSLDNSLLPQSLTTFSRPTVMDTYTFTTIVQPSLSATETSNLVRSTESILPSASTYLTQSQLNISSSTSIGAVNTQSVSSTVAVSDSSLDSLQSTATLSSIEFPKTPFSLSSSYEGSFMSLQTSLPQIETSIYLATSTVMTLSSSNPSVSEKLTLKPSPVSRGSSSVFMSQRSEGISVTTEISASPTSLFTSSTTSSTNVSGIEFSTSISPSLSSVFTTLEINASSSAVFDTNSSVAMTSSIIITTVKPTLTTPNATNAKEAKWVRTVMKIQRSINVSDPNFVSEMEKSFATAYNEAFIREKLIEEGKFEPLERRRRKKRFTRVGDAAVHIHELSRVDGNVEVAATYAVERSGILLPAEDAVAALDVLNTQELAILLKQVVDVKAEPYGHTETLVEPDDKGSDLWLIAVIVGPIIGAIIVIWIIACIYCKLCRRQEVEDDSEPELTSIHPQPSKQKFSDPDSSTCLTLKQISERRPLPVSPKKTFVSQGSKFSLMKGRTYEINDGYIPEDDMDGQALLKSPVKNKQTSPISSGTGSMSTTPVLPKKELAPPMVKKERRNSRNSIGPSQGGYGLNNGGLKSASPKSDISHMFQSNVSEDSEDTKKQLKRDREKNKDRMNDLYSQEFVSSPHEEIAAPKESQILGMPNTTVPSFKIESGSPAKEHPASSRRPSFQDGNTSGDENLAEARSRMHKLLDDAFSLISPRASLTENDLRTNKSTVQQKDDSKSNMTAVDAEKAKETLRGFVNADFGNSYSGYLETWSPYRASDQVALISMPHQPEPVVTRLGSRPDKRPATSRPAPTSRRPAAHLDQVGSKSISDVYQPAKYTTSSPKPIVIRTKDDGFKGRIESCRSDRINNNLKNNRTISSTTFNSDTLIYGSGTALSLSEQNTRPATRDSVEMQPMGRTRRRSSVRKHRVPEKYTKDKDEVDVVHNIKREEATHNLVTSLRDELRSSKIETDDDINKKPIRRKNRKVMSKPMTDIV